MPVIIARGWSPAQKRAYILADNQLALNAGWDESLLRVELAALGEMGFDLPLVGFGEDFLAGLLGKNDGLADPDSSPQLNGLSFSVVVRCKDETHQGELLAKLEKEGLTCEALIS